MLRKGTALVVLAAFSLWTSGCAATQKTVQRPSSEFVSHPPSPTETVRVRALVTNDGERVEFPGDRLALLMGQRVLVFSEEARLVTADLRDAIVSRGADTVSVRVDGRSYEKVLMVAETPECATFVAGAESPDREIPLAEIADLHVEEKGASQGDKILAGVLIGLGALVLLGILTYAIQGEP